MTDEQRAMRDVRPNRKRSDSGPEMVFDKDGIRHTMRQVGWLGQTGAFYSLDEDPKPTEPGSFGPLWFTAHAEKLPCPRCDDDGWVECEAVPNCSVESHGGYCDCPAGVQRAKRDGVDV